MTTEATVEVTPTVFTKVEYEADVIARTAREVAAQIPGLPDTVEIRIEVDQEEPTPRVAVTSLDPIVLTVESGALEETKAPRTFGESQASLTFARLLFEVRDRLDADFGAPELGEPQDLAIKAAWEASCVGRASRLGFYAHKPRFRYNFRNRFGFSDAADARFDAIWANDQPRYADFAPVEAAA